MVWLNYISKSNAIIHRTLMSVANSCHVFNDSVITQGNCIATFFIYINNEPTLFSGIAD